MQIRIDHLDANPYRHIDRYPIREDKITALQESINTTGFWDNLVGRKVGDRVQIAYGHHRREALLRTFPADYKIGIVVREFNEDQMLKIMARENMEEWGNSASIEHETVRAVVEAYGAGKIELEPPDPKTSANRLRYAPSFVMGDGRPAVDDHPYTASTVAEFLGWNETKAKSALGALELIEQKHLSDADFVGLGTVRAAALVIETNDIVRKQQRQRDEEAAALANVQDAEKRKAAEREVKRREAERKKVAQQTRKQLTTDLRDSNVGVNEARKEARKIRESYEPEKPPMDFPKYAHRIAKRLEKLLTEGEVAEGLGNIRKYQTHLPDEHRLELIEELRGMRQIIDSHLAWLSVSVPDYITDGDVIDADLAEISS